MLDVSSVSNKLSENWQGSTVLYCTVLCIVLDGRSPFCKYRKGLLEIKFYLHIELKSLII